MKNLVKNIILITACTFSLQASVSLHNMESSNYEIDDTIPFQWRPLDKATHLSSYSGDEANFGWYLNDDRHAIINLGFKFKYYNSEFEQVLIGTNGLMVLWPASSYNHFTSFYSCFDEYDNAALPDYRCNVIAPFWDDLYLEGGVILYETTGDEGNHEFIVTWHNVKATGAPGENGIYFQAILQESTGDIIFNYHDVDLGSPELDKGKSATVGLSDPYGHTAALYSFNEASLRPGQSIRFHFREGIFPPLILSPVPGTNLDSEEVTVKWAYNGIVPKYTFLQIGNQANSFNLGTYRISGVSEFDISNLPCNGDPLYIRLMVQSNDGIVYQSNTSCNTTKITDGFTISGMVLSSSSNLINNNNKYKIDLLRNDPSGSTIVARTTTDNSYSFRFTGIPAGEYEVANRIDGQWDSETSALGRNSPTQHVVVTDHDVYVQFPYLNPCSDLEPSRFSFVNTRNVTFRWRGSSGPCSYSWTLYNENGVEIANTSTTENSYTYPVPLDAGKTYYWDIQTIDSQGKVYYESKNIQFQIPDSQPLITSPMPGRFLDWGHSLYLRWSPSGTTVERWKLVLRNEENGTPFWEGEFDGTSIGADFPNLPYGHPRVYVDLSYMSSGVWHDNIHAHYYLEIVDYLPRMVSPLPGTQLQKDHQTFVWEVTGCDTANLKQDPFELEIISPDGVVFRSQQTRDWKVENIGDNRYSATIGVLPANGEDLLVRLDTASEYATTEHPFPFKAYEGGAAGQQNYLAVPCEYDWIDGTLGIRCDLKWGPNPDAFTDLPLPFPFTFYGQPYEYLRVTEDGITTFSSGYKGYLPLWGYNQNIFPGPGNPDAVVAPYAGGINRQGGGGVYYRTVGTSPNRKFIVEWNRVSHASNYPSNEGDVTFQMVLLESTNEIVFQYKDVIYQEGLPDNFGAGQIVGIENQDGSKSCIYSYKSPSLRNESAVKFTPQ